METIVEKQRKRVGYSDNLRKSKNGFAQLLAVRLEDIVWREQMNRNMIHLYRIGNMWLAFDKSAYFMWQATPCEPMGLRLDIAPFSVIIVDIETVSLPMLYRKFIVKEDAADYKSFFTAFSLGLYEDWRRQNI